MVTHGSSTQRLPASPSRRLPASRQGLLDDIQASLLAQARAFRDDNIVDVSSYDELKEAVAAGEQALLLLSRLWQSCRDCIQMPRRPGVPSLSASV